MPVSPWRFFQYRDAMEQEAKFARQKTNDQILTVQAAADSRASPRRLA
jgi:hypothetical protein